MHFADNQDYPYWLRYISFIGFNYLMILLCSCIGEYISRDAEGSGVPEMKAVLAGVHLHNFYSIKSFIGKWIGIVLSIAGSLSMGR